MLLVFALLAIIWALCPWPIALALTLLGLWLDFGD